VPEPDRQASTAAHTLVRGWGCSLALRLSGIFPRPIKGWLLMLAWRLA
jgi:hypothetical protein